MPTGPFGGDIFCSPSIVSTNAQILHKYICELRKLSQDRLNRMTIAKGGGDKGKKRFMSGRDS